MNKKKRILYVVTDVATAGGVMSIISKKVNYLVQNGYIVDILSITRSEKTFYKLHKNVKLLFFDSHNGNILKNLISTLRMIKQTKYDIIISADAQYMTWVLPFFSSSKKILELHQSYDGIIEYIRDRYHSKLVSSFFSFLKKIAYPFYDRIITLTEEDREKWGYRQTLVIPNFHTLEIKQEVQETKKAIVCVGRFHHQKGYQLLIEAWKLVAPLYPDWKLDYYGEAICSTSLQILKDLNAPVSFELKGYESNPDKLYGGNYLNIVPSISESFSLSVIEAMCYSVPSVSFDITGPRSIIKNGVNGVLVDAYNTKELAYKIISLIENKPFRNMLSQACLETATYYAQDKIMAKWLELFENI